MSAPQTPQLDRRLEAYFATLRSSPLRDAVRRKVEMWQFYAAVAGSAIAMATGASAAMISGGPANVTPVPIPGVLAADQHAEGSNFSPLLKVMRLAGAKSSQPSAGTSPAISAGGVVPIFGTENIIQPGELVSIYGTNLAGETANWNGDFPISLGGTSVEINGKAAYLIFVSPGQINLQAPSDTTTGVVPVTVTTAVGTASSTVTLSQFAPSFTLLDTSHICGIILRSNGSGAYGGGTYDILGPTGSSYGYPTVAAKPGDIVELFGVGFGPTNPAVPAGVAFEGAATVISPFTLSINDVVVAPSFVGLSSAGLYQINLTVPHGLGHGDVLIQATVGEMQTQPGVLFPLRKRSTSGGGGSTGSVGVGTGGAAFTFGGGTCGGQTGAGRTCGGGSNPGGTNTNPGGTNTGGTNGGGGTGGGSVATPIGQPYYVPRLQYPRK